MLLGHLPAGYLCTRLAAPEVRGVLAAGLVGAVAPDFDMVWFWLDGGRIHHHAYPTHWPAVWGAALGLSALGWAATRSRAGLLGVVFSANGLVHLVLDSIVGDVAWLAPLSHERFALFTVPRVWEPWWVNFVLHWSFGLELGLALLAAVLVWRDRRGGRTGVGTGTGTG